MAKLYHVNWVVSSLLWIKSLFILVIFNVTTFFVEELLLWIWGFSYFAKVRFILKPFHNFQRIQITESGKNPKACEKHSCTNSQQQESINLLSTGGDAFSLKVHIFSISPSSLLSVIQPRECKSHTQTNGCGSVTKSAALHPCWWSLSLNWLLCKRQKNCWQLLVAAEGLSGWVHVWCSALFNSCDWCSGIVAPRRRWATRTFCKLYTSTAGQYWQHGCHKAHKLFLVITNNLILASCGSYCLILTLQFI